MSSLVTLKTLAAIAMVSAFGATALALPTETLYVRASHLGEEKLIYFVSYTVMPTANGSGYGSMIQPMTESVADTLSTLTLDQLMTCDAHVFHEERTDRVYSLTNCH